MTISEFFESEEGIAIHCNTKEKAIALLGAFDRAGYTWCVGFKYNEGTYWERCKEETCYSNANEYASREFYEGEGYRIIEFEEIEDIEQPKYIEVIQECIRLLSVDGANTKQQVKEMLERLVDGNTDN